MKGHEERLECANKLIEEIADCGRRFFYHDGRVSRLERDKRGRIWFIDAWRGKRIYTHYNGHWRRFSEGGTLRNLIERLRDFIVHGYKLGPSAFGPWPEWVCGGDLWGYGEDMERVRHAAMLLGIVDTTKRSNA